eukprot:Awhi_evm1s11349
MADNSIDKYYCQKWLHRLTEFEVLESMFMEDYQLNNEELKVQELKENLNLLLDQLEKSNAIKRNSNLISNLNQSLSDLTLA